MEEPGALAPEGHHPEIWMDYLLVTELNLRACGAPTPLVALL